MTTVKTRGNQITVSLTFRDDADDTITLSSASLKIVYPAAHRLEASDTITMTESSGTWSATWDSSVSRGGWIKYSAQGLEADSTPHVLDGRFKIRDNIASLERDQLEGTSPLRDYYRPYYV